MLPSRFAMLADLLLGVRIYSIHGCGEDGCDRAHLGIGLCPHESCRPRAAGRALYGGPVIRRVATTPTCSTVSSMTVLSLIASTTSDTSAVARGDAACAQLSVGGGVGILRGHLLVDGRL